MITRIALMVALALAGWAQTGSAQAPQKTASGQGPQKQIVQIVLSPSVLKSLTAQKPKSKAPRGAGIRVMRRAPAATAVAPSSSRAPTAVREVPRSAGK